MTDVSIKQDLLWLRNRIDQADQVYYGSGTEGYVADSVYDDWKRQLKELAPDDPRLSRVGAPLDSSCVGKKVRHTQFMGSLNNANNVEEFLAWVQALPEHESLSFQVSFKMDGGSVALYYENGVLKSAVTRGDGKEGEDITANALCMQGVPRTVPGFTGAVRGEVVLTLENWKEADPDQLTNPRNLGNGISRRHNGEGAHLLSFYAFDLSPDRYFETQDSKAQELCQLGFTPAPYLSALRSDEVIRFYEQMQSDVMTGYGLPSRNQLPFWIDGLVVKVEDLDVQREMGVVNNRPKGQIAFKFPPEQVRARLKDVVVTLGRTGVLIPNAVLEPVFIGGTTVKAASLHNWDNVKQLDVAIGDLVVVEKACDIIPQVVTVVERAPDRIPVKPPKKCPITGGNVYRRLNLDGKKQSVHLYTDDTQHPVIRKGRILKWLTSLNILGLGAVGVDKLYDAGIVTDVVDLYSASSQARFAEVLGEKVAAKVVDRINATTTLTTSQFLGSLGIEYLDQRRVELTQEKDPGQFQSVWDWIEGDKLLTRAKEAGLPKLAKHIHADIQRNMLPIGLAMTKIKVEANPVVEQPKEGMVFCLTGNFEHPKEHYHIAIINAGHRYVESYTKKAGISYVVAADPASGSTKLKRAAKDGVAVISDQQLMEILHETNLHD